VAGLRRCVLIVDDEPDIVLTMKHPLEAGFPGIKILTARSGKKALERLRAHMGALMLTDYKMPGMNGIELMHHAHEILPELATILFTAFPDLNLAKTTLNEAGVRRFWVKPSQPEPLLEATAQALLVSR
jgi:YesN/AraC family two-component response regulator